MHRFGVYAAVLTLGFGDLPFRDGCQFQFPPTPDAGSDASAAADASDAEAVEAASDAQVAVDSGLDAGQADVEASPGLLSVSTTSLTFSGTCASSPGDDGMPAPPQSFEVTNAGGTPISWIGTVDGPFSIEPTGSVLSSGQSVTVVVTPAPILTATSNEIVGDLFVSTPPNDAGVEEQSVLVLLEEIVTGEIVSPPSTIDFGNVPLLQPVSQFIPVGSSGEQGLTSSNFEFELSGVVPNLQPGGAFGWTLTFLPEAPGLQSTTLTFVAPGPGGPVCLPNTFMATGTGVPDDAGVDAG